MDHGSFGGFGGGIPVCHFRALCGLLTFLPRPSPHPCEACPLIRTKEALPMSHYDAGAKVCLRTGFFWDCVPAPRLGKGDAGRSSSVILCGSHRPRSFLKTKWQLHPRELELCSLLSHPEFISAAFVLLPLQRPPPCH